MNEITFINLTPHDIRVGDTVIKASGTVARCQERKKVKNDERTRAKEHIRPAREMAQGRWWRTG
jgi:hypothetical protein